MRTSGLHKFIIQIIDGRDKETMQIIWRPLQSDKKEETTKINICNENRFNIHGELNKKKQ